MTVSSHSLLKSSSSTVLLSSYFQPNVPNFCSNCGSDQMELKIPDGDDHVRAVCNDCHTVVYENPKVVVSCVILATTTSTTSTLQSPNDVNDDSTTNSPQVLLAKRAIEPRMGYFGIPQGYMEMDDVTSRHAVCREVYEETGATITPDQLTFRGLYNVPGSVQLVYSVVVQSTDAINISTTTTESTEIKFFPIHDLPELCFPTVQWAIDHCVSFSTNNDKPNNNNNNKSGSSNNVISTIQQKNKLYNAATNEWSDSEDFDATDSTSNSSTS